MKLTFVVLGVASSLLALGCRDVTHVESPPVPITEGYGARTVALVECTANLRRGTLDCADAGVEGASGGQPGQPSRAIYGQGQVRLRSFNVRYDTTTLGFGWDLKLYNLLAEPIGTPDGTTVTGIKAFFDVMPYATSFVAPHDTGTISVSTADGVQSFTRPNQAYHLYNQLLQPGDSTPARRWELKVPRSVNTFSMTFRVFAAVPSEPRVPSLAPDSVPESLYAGTNVATDLAGMSGTYLRDIVTVLFHPNATLDERQAALDQTGGTVVGGSHISDGDGFYLVRVAGDGTAAPILNAIQKLRSLPQVMGAAPEFVEDAEDALSYARPDDGLGWQSKEWNLDPNRATTGGRWGLEAIAAPLAWGCETGDAGIKIGIVDAGIYPDQAEDVRLNTRERHFLASVPMYKQNGSPLDHGTRVGSVAAARGGNDQGMAGVMWNAHLTLVELRTTNAGIPTSNMSGRGTIRGMARRVGVAMGSGARVINMSFGHKITPAQAARVRNGAATTSDSTGVREYAKSLHGAIRWNRFRFRRPLLVIAAGNAARTGVDAEGIPELGVLDAFWSGYPILAAEYPDQVIAVGGAALAPTPTSGFGGGPFLRADFAQGGALVTIAAPAKGVGTMDKFGAVVAASGTSFAAPLVTGAAGLLFSFDPSLTAAEVINLLVVGARRGNRYIDDPLVTRVPLLNVHESLKMAAERPGRRLCGNRVWVNDGKVYARRVVNGQESSEELSAFNGDLDDVRIPHGGSRIDLYSSEHNEYRYLRWSPSGWQAEPVPADSANAWYDNYGPTMRSFYGESHDNDSTVSFRVGNNQVEVYLRARASVGEQVLGSVPFHEKPALPTACVRESWRQVNGQQVDYRCIDSTQPGSWIESEWPSVAYAPRGNQVLLAVSEKSHSVAIAGEWYDCRRDDEADSTRVERCRNTSVSRQTRPASIYAFSSGAGQRRTLATDDVTFSDLAISDGTEEFVVSSEREVSPTILFKYVKDARGVYVGTTEGPTTFTACKSQFRGLTDGVLKAEYGTCGSSTHTFAPDRRSAGTPQLQRSGTASGRSRVPPRVPAPQRRSN